jgi:hypothetical protein
VSKAGVLSVAGFSGGNEPFAFLRTVPAVDRKVTTFEKEQNAIDALCQPLDQDTDLTRKAPVESGAATVDRYKFALLGFSGRQEIPRHFPVQDSCFLGFQAA